jgi:hypothetical protein
MTGSRLYYRWRFEQAHTAGDFYKAFPASARSFEIPGGMKPERSSQPHELDVLFLEDLRLPNGDKVLEDIEIMRGRGASIGLVHLPCPTRKIEEWPDLAISELVDGRAVRFIPHGEHVGARLVVLKDARNLEYYSSLIPKINSNHVAVVVGRNLISKIELYNNRYVDSVLEVVRRYFDTPITWYPESDGIRRRLSDLGLPEESAMQLSECNWPATIASKTWSAVGLSCSMPDH